MKVKGITIIGLSSFKVTKKAPAQLLVGKGTGSETASNPGANAADYATVTALTMVPVKGAKVGDIVLCAINKVVGELGNVFGEVTATDEVTVYVQNFNNAAITLGSGTAVTVLVIRVPA